MFHYYGMVVAILFAIYLILNGSKKCMSFTLVMIFLLLIVNGCMAVLVTTIDDEMSEIPGY